MENRQDAHNLAKSGLGRREFIGTAAAALFAGVVIQLVGCSTDEDGTPSGSGNAVGEVSSNHGHSAAITKAQLDSGGTLTLDIQGTSGHTHTVVLTAEEMANIKALVHVMKDSSTTNAHVHSVMFN